MVDYPIRTLSGTVPLPSGAATEAKQDIQITAEQAFQATLGATTGAAVVTDANGTVQQYLRGLTKRWADALGAGTAAAALRTTSASDSPLVTQWTAGTLNFASQGYSASATFTPANTSHVALDVCGGAQTFSSIGPASRHINVAGVTLRIDGSAAEATAWRLRLYNVTPPSAYADDAAWDIGSGDRASYLGYIDIPTAADEGSTQWVEVWGINKRLLMPASANLFAYLTNLTTLTMPAVDHVVTLFTESV